MEEIRKKRKYYARCCYCNARHELKDMVRVGNTKSTYMCMECFEDSIQPNSPYNSEDNYYDDYINSDEYCSY